MEIKCRSILAAPLITLIKLHSTLNVKGVAGILTKNSKQNIDNMTIGALGLLSYYQELTVSSELVEKVIAVDVTLEKGGVNYNSLADTSRANLSVPDGLDNLPFAMTTDKVSFKLLIAKSTVEDPLTEKDVYEYASPYIQSGYEFTAIPLPLLTKRILTFDTRTEGQFTTITCHGASGQDFEELISSLDVN